MDNNNHHNNNVIVYSLPSNWPQRAPAASAESGIITITGASLRSLTTDDISLVNSQWVYRNATSMEHLLHAVQHYPSVGCSVDGNVNHGMHTPIYHTIPILHIIGVCSGII